MAISPASFRFTLLLGVLAGLPALSIDMSAPTLQQLPQDLHTTTLVAGLTLSLFMAGFAVGQMVGGQMSDRHGRKPVLLCGMLLYTLAGLACAAASSGEALVAARAAQGIGAGACSVLPFAIVQDLFVGDAARSKRSYIAVVFGLVPVLAPAVGAVVSDVAGWRAVHVVLAASGGILVAIVLLFFQETVAPDARRSAGVWGAVARLWRDRRFVALTVINALCYGCIFAYIAGAPVVVIGQWGLPKGAFAIAFASTALALTAGAWTSGRLGRRGLRAGTLIMPAILIGAAASVLLVMTAYGLAQPRYGIVLLGLLGVVLFCRGILAPNLQHLAMQQRAGDAGVASAAIGVSQLTLGTISSGVVAALLPGLGLQAIAVPMAVMSIMAAAIWLWRSDLRS